VSGQEFDDEDDDFIYAPQRARGQRLDPAITRMALGAGGVSLLVILVALFYSGFRTSGFGPPPEIAPPATPLRVAPTSPGGMMVPGADVPIMSGNTAQFSATPQLAPDDAAPAVNALDQDAGLNQPPAPPVAPAAPATAPPAAPAVTAPNLPALVLLAANSDLASAMTAWSTLQRQFPAQLKGKSPLILPVGSSWQVRLGGFPSSAAASSFCATLTAKGASCAVVTN
jgi:hypothetical protein